MSIRLKGAWPHVLALVLLVAFTVGVRVARAPLHEPLSHDESISVMHAAGKSIGYADMLKAESAPYGTWTPFSTWQSYLRPDGADLGAALDSVRATDQHPPLYFLSVSAWQGAFGSSRDAGWLVNLLFSALTAAALYALGYALTRDVAVAALGGAIWAAMPGAIETSLTIRQYDLLALLTVVLAWRAIAGTRDRDRLSYVDMVAMALVSVLGLMTHIYFVLPMAAAWVWVTYKTFRRGWRTSVLLAVALAVALGAAMLINPDSFGVGDKASRPGVSNTVSAMLGRGERFAAVLVKGSGITPGTLRTVQGFGKHAGLPSRPAMILALALLAAAIAAIVWFRADRKTFMRALRDSGPVWFFFAWLTAIVWAMYMVIPGLSPALGDRYIAMSWPFLGLGLGIALSGLSRYRWLAPAMLTCALALNVAYANLWGPRFSAPQLASAQRVVIDDPARGVLLPYADVASPDTEVFAAWRRDLVAEPSAWVDRLQPGDLIVLEKLYQPEKLAEDDVLDLVKQRWDVKKVKTFSGLRGNVYVVTGPSMGTP